MNIRNGMIIVAILTAALTGGQGIGDPVYQKETDGVLRWLLAHRDEPTGLPYSHVGDPRFERWTITYDAAVVALAYVAAGRTADAEKILDFYLKTPQVWRLGGIIEAVVAGEQVSGKDWSVRSGANLWMGIAALHVYQATGEPRFLELARTLADFALALQDKIPDSFNFGGIPLGPPGDPAFENDQRLGHDPSQRTFQEIFATEVNIDAYVLFSMLAKETREESYHRAAQDVFAWLKAFGYNNRLHRFNRGYGDEAAATDVHSWAVSALGWYGLESIAPGSTENILRFVEEQCLVEVGIRKPDGTTVQVRGVDFVDRDSAKALKRNVMISPEWTFQLANAYLRLEREDGRRGLPAEAERMEQKRSALIRDMLKLAVQDNNGTLAFPYATLADAPIGHEYRTPAEGNLSAIGAAYGILALQGYDPLDLNRRDF